MRKLPAFTLVEISVAMIISSIVIVLAMNLYLKLSKSNQKILQEYDDNLQILQFSAIMNNDFDKFEKAEFSIYELKFSDYNSSCLYEFTDIGIIRKTEELTDTFKIEYQNLDYRLQHGNTGLLTNLSFEIKYLKNVIPFSFYKEYNTADKVNYSIIKK